MSWIFEGALTILALSASFLCVALVHRLKVQNQFDRRDREAPPWAEMPSQTVVDPVSDEEAEAIWMAERAQVMESLALSEHQQPWQSHEYHDPINGEHTWRQG